jgi:hypothetical protein
MLEFVLMLQVIENHSLSIITKGLRDVRIFIFGENF